ncbi:ABC transporter ATP-binding protein [Candidatus Methanodesulfokora washburnensis]|jgi:peptide/nickel transport system ATP-binding protein|uniref:ABC transporter ATP-binding protein n=2 Tax=Candidatus Methanodesulfokora washburnensis TaxID=2478471 RepID=A0A3R9PV17_9CREN|nr:ABC transporter ATP-binding protein [Candidatus Methanodesulfokores washburnensis]RSN73875.1 ABC transporter ATP-binding protein [Candidatus Methanodesulfokores washburnensis]
MPILNVNNLKAYFLTIRGAVRAVDNVSFSLEKGESLGLAGESGCGKSTLGYALINLLPPPGKIMEGSILIDGIDVAKLSEDELRKKVRWKKISMIFQGAMNALNPVYTVGYQMSEPLIYHEGMNKKEALEEAKRYLELVGLSRDVVNRYPHELSGGMKQRVMIATALILKPTVLIADEPTTALDVIVQAQIINLMKKLKRELGISIIFISHDLSIISEIADRVAIMYAGKIVELGSSDSVYLKPKHPYTQALLRAVPRIKGKKEKLTFIPGAPPNLIEPPSGCRFHPRCPYAFDRCIREEPELKQVESGHFVACHLY